MLSGTLGSASKKSPLTPKVLTQAQTRQVLRLYHVYRLAIGLVLLLLTHSDLLALANFTALQYSLWVYLGLNLILALSFNRTEPSWLLGLALLDILLLLSLFYWAGGTSSGIGSLVVVSVAIVNILLHGQLGFFLAAIASLGLIYLTFYLSLSHSAANNQLVQAGTLGALCFAAALLVQGLSRRWQHSEELARRRAKDVAHLETLNALILQRIHLGILVVDAQYQVVLTNQRALHLLGLETLSGHLLTQYSAPLFLRLQQWQHNPSRWPESISTPKARLQPGFTALQDDQRQTLIFLEDLSPIAQQAQQLKLASLGRLTASIAHEIRNPLGAISHAAQLLLESEQLPEADLRLAQIIYAQTQRVNQIIENVLYVSRRRPANPQHLVLNPWLGQCVDELRTHLTPEQQIHLDMAKQPLSTHIDPSQLAQVLTNLVQNGLRYSKRQHSKAQVWLRLYADARSGLAVLEVLDDGPGIASTHVQHIFEPFFTTDHQGTGLGLYLCRELCDSNQARIDYHPRLEGGSCFRITFAHPNRLPL
ncbi:Sensor protein PilS [Azomonas agilis]|uniref:histidine kinase n=1 Tax=Azomonas agilis TaxID=116849 RepID=A0A562J301_9GAMM|nr:Sensor protein PilS [Azomonas agilis]